MDASNVKFAPLDVHIPFFFLTSGKTIQLSEFCPHVPVVLEPASPNVLVNLLLSFVR
jgi:hypothetical protein